MKQLSRSERVTLAIVSIAVLGGRRRAHGRP